MENDLQVFNNDQFGNVRVYTDEKGEPWFVAADVCKCLDIGDTSRACERLDDDEKGTTLIRTPGGNQQMLTVNEPGLYTLVLSSRKPEAKPFKRWIAHEVVPSIRKTGAYISKPMSPAEILVAQAQMLLDQERRLAAQEHLSGVMSAKIDKLESYVKNHPDDHISIVGYAKVRGCRNVGLEEAKTLGKRAAKMSKSMGYEVKKVSDCRFGKVNTYHLDVLEKVFDDWLSGGGA